jgi:phospholipase C
VPARFKTLSRHGGCRGRPNVIHGNPHPLYAGGTATPIKHVIVIIGENRGFDHIFATYKPVNKSEYVLNLLSKKIVNPDGSPGPRYGDAPQYQASDTTIYQFAPPKTPYVTLPPPLTSGPSTPFVCKELGITTGTSCVTPANVQAAKAFENGLPDNYYPYLLTGGTGQKPGVPDARINYNGHDASHLPPGPFQITSKTFPYDAYTSNVTHRFFQMWQELDCAAGAARAESDQPVS